MNNRLHSVKMNCAHCPSKIPVENPVRVVPGRLGEYGFFECPDCGEPAMVAIGGRICQC